MMCVYVCVCVCVVCYNFSVALERIEKVTLSPTAWQCQYGDMAAADDTCVPECTEGFMGIIAGITGRGGEECEGRGRRVGQGEGGV